MKIQFKKKEFMDIMSIMNNTGQILSLQEMASVPRD